MLSVLKASLITLGTLCGSVGSVVCAQAASASESHAALRRANAALVVDARQVQGVGWKEELEKIKKKVRKPEGTEAGNDQSEPASAPLAGAAAERISEPNPGACDPRRDVVIELGDVCAGGLNRQVYVSNRTSRVVEASFRTYQKQKDGRESKIEQRGGIGAYNKTGQLCGVRAEVFACQFMN